MNPGMFDKLIDLFILWFKWFMPFFIVDHWRRALVLRQGVFNRRAGPGFCWRIPFGIEKVIWDSVNARTTNLGVQSLVTKDGRKVNIQAVVTSSICDIKKSLLDAETVDEALKDSCVGEVGLLVAETNWEDMRKREFYDELTRRCHEPALRYGQFIEKVQLQDCAPGNSLRLWLDK